MPVKNKLAIPIRYDIFLQDLSHDYQDLKYLGYANDIEQARICCKLLKESLLTASARGVCDINYSNCTVIFRPVLHDKEH